MTLLWIIMLLVLGCCNVYLIFSKRRLYQQLTYTHQKLQKILDRETKENIQISTGDQELRQLLVVLNRLLAEKNKVVTTYTQMENSIRTMHTNMSHDLKTPLTVILGLSETLVLDQTLSIEERNRLVVKINNKAQNMLDLMNKFFELAKLESGDTDLPLTKTNLNEICKDSILFFYEQISSSGLEVKIDIPETPIFANSNVPALNRILHNLLSNALRYGQDGQVVGIKLRFDDEHAWIDVWDRGKGISAREQDLIFERLYTLEDSRNSKYQGSGLGLTITKRLVKKLNGQIMLSSKPYEKTLFTLRFDRVLSSHSDFERLS